MGSRKNSFYNTFPLQCLLLVNFKKHYLQICSDCVFVLRPSAFSCIHNIYAASPFLLWTSFFSLTQRLFSLIYKSLPPSYFSTFLFSFSLFHLFLNSILHTDSLLRYVSDSVFVNIVMVPRCHQELPSVLYHPEGFNNYMLSLI